MSSSALFPPHVRGQVAQLVERSPEKAGVGGSTPSLATIFFNQLRRITEKPSAQCQPMILVHCGQFTVTLLDCRMASSISPCAAILSFADAVCVQLQRRF